MSNTRYTVGQKVLFLHIDFENMGQGMGTVYCPWIDKLNTLDFRLLTCVEHKRVPGNYDDDIKYDDFIFTDQSNDRWLNQYPRASYGQLSDDENYKVSVEDEFENVEQHLNRIRRGISYFKDNDKEKYASSLEEFRDTLIATIEKDYGGKVTQEPLRKNQPGVLFYKVNFE